MLPPGGTTYSPIVFIPGKGGSQIEAKVTPNNPGYIKFPNCPETVPWFRIWLDVWHFLWPGKSFVYSKYSHGIQIAAQAWPKMVMTLTRAWQMT